MANWASTSYCIEGQQCDLREIFNLCKDFIECKRKPMKENADCEWEGNIVMALEHGRGKILPAWVHTNV